MTEQELALFWREPHVAKLATINPDGTPHLMPLWYLHDGQNLLMITSPDSWTRRSVVSSIDTVT
jgi:general stress protein 26